ncbi:helix-turn-helix domain-containing protein [Glycomyces algeriensis]|uniref:HTH cro/C1-type domain-containing protein n=1 Tax=Glycomyces algeriensis TaxID=256037 RepID=A0A9W6G5X9_9ACTN|nr:XRE family transcriptional regulator [Glycomyces algeriensis]MDA1368393.1 XRE family transcriptional regulator [Glycomyces algeriensis]MDR7353199.1 Zn-dependent peptidase ImmA (M78 family)/DNA-binding XRE family transcriptional regulator [Glycomyces algeriensis]GLI40893.1 hypothetical protein GALLR39Z86_07430 [Glycomyces algeriensis]
MSYLGEALITARRALGLTQAELASAAGITQAALSRYETDQRVPESEVLTRLAKALKVTEQFLQKSGELRGAMAIDAHMRRHATAKPGVWKQLEAKLNMHRMHARYLAEEIIIRAGQHVPKFDPIEVEPDKAARLTRMQWKMPIGSVRALIQWLEAAGCIVIEEDFETSRVSGLSQWVEDIPVILINSRIPTCRKRLTLAHELGHLCLHSEFVTQDMESEANSFAAEFLMPAEIIKYQLRQLSVGKLIDLKREWGVSMQALIERAHDLDQITDRQRTNFYKNLSARGWRTQEPISDELPPEHPRLPQAIGNAMRQRGLSSKEISTMVGFSEDGSHPFIPTVSVETRSLRVVR